MDGLAYGPCGCCAGAQIHGLVRVVLRVDEEILVLVMIPRIALLNIRPFLMFNDTVYSRDTLQQILVGFNSKQVAWREFNEASVGFVFVRKALPFLARTTVRRGERWIAGSAWRSLANRVEGLLIHTLAGRHGAEVANAR